MIGFDSIKTKLLKNYQENKLHHALMLVGKKGIGKASFAEEFIREILNHRSEIHPDLLIIKTLENKKEISVDQIREISKFINQSAAVSNNKFILIDSADELNKSSSNALLKILEEPHQNNYFLLICHNVSKILATIKSRCHIEKINDLSKDVFHRILKEKSEFSDDEINILAQICDNSPALAINNGKDLIDIYKLLLSSIKNKKLDDNLIKKTSDKNFDFNNFTQIINFFLWKLANKNDFIFDEEEVFAKLRDKNIFEISDNINTSLNKVVGLNLDKKLAVINVINELV